MAQKTFGEMFGINRPSIFRDKNTLSPDYIPETAVHRDYEIKHLASILSPVIHGSKASNVFIYGTTGTGKSLSVRQVAKEIEARSDKVKILYINCKMKRVSDTEYRILAELSRILGKNVPLTGLPTDQVYKIFYSAIEEQSKMIVLILDEIDALVKKIGDGILYNLTRVNQELKKSKISIIGISNDLTFTENMDPRVKSSLSEEEMVFPPYNATQLKDILNQRVLSAFHPGSVESNAVSKCAALAAQEHGDARKALDLLRISAELAERTGANKVTTDHVDRAEDKFDFDRTVEVVRKQPKQSLAVLAAMVNLVEKGEKNIQTGDVFHLYQEICPATGLKVLTQRRVSDLIGELDMLGVLNTRVVSKGRHGRTREIQMLLSNTVIKKIKNILKENYIL